MWAPLAWPCLLVWVLELRMGYTISSGWNQVGYSGSSPFSIGFSWRRGRCDINHLCKRHSFRSEIYPQPETLTTLSTGLEPISFGTYGLFVGVAMAITVNADRAPIRGLTLNAFRLSPSSAESSPNSNCFKTHSAW